MATTNKMLLTAAAVLMVGTASAWALTQMPFRADGSFKICQFADMHYSIGRLSGCSDISPDQRPCSDLNTTDFIGRVLDLEKPDLVVYTGDNVAGFMEAAKAIRDYSQVVVDRQIPWAMVFGNHDDEANLNREEMMDVVLSIPYAISERGPADIDGIGNYVVQLMSSNNQTNLVNLWFIDSGAYSTKPGISGYDWVRPSQIAWYSAEAERLRAANGGRVAPALAFFHIPLPEYELVSGKVGDTQEAVFDADLNSGLYTAFIESGDVKATFVGHDHVNDYCGQYYGVNLCYGGGVGYGTYGKVGWARRARVIEFRNNGDTLVTWKRLDDPVLTQKDVQTLYGSA